MEFVGIRIVLSIYDHIFVYLGFFFPFFFSNLSYFSWYSAILAGAISENTCLPVLLTPGDLFLLLLLLLCSSFFFFFFSLISETSILFPTLTEV